MAGFSFFALLMVSAYTAQLASAEDAMAQPEVALRTDVSDLEGRQWVAAVAVSTIFAPLSRACGLVF